MKRPMTSQQFSEVFPDNDACLDFLFHAHKGVAVKACSHCGKKTKFYRVKGRKCYECGNCGHQVYPLAGTVFKGLKGSLMEIFQVIHKFGITNGLSTRQIMDEFGYTYKKAWSLCHKVRKLMKEDIGQFSGILEVDETLIGGKRKRGGTKGKSDERALVFGMRERETGMVKAYFIGRSTNNDKATIHPIILREAKLGSTIHSDESAIYTPLNEMGFKHCFIPHKPKKMEDGTVRKRVFRCGNVTTNGVESSWSHLKRFIFGKHMTVSEKYLQNYLDEFCFRQNWRNRREQITYELLSRLRLGFGTHSIP